MNADYQQLTQVQRYQIEAGLASGESQSSIAKEVGVYRSTISREIRRNSMEEGYEATHAQCKSMIRRKHHTSFKSQQCGLGNDFLNGLKMA